MPNLRSRKVGSCGLCAKWQFHTQDWGKCTSVNENSEARGHILYSDDSRIVMEYRTRKDFGCRQFQEMDMFKA